MTDQEPLSTLKDDSSPAADHARTVAGSLPRSRDDDPATSRNRAAAPVICLPLTEPDDPGDVPPGSSDGMRTVTNPPSARRTPLEADALVGATHGVEATAHPRRGVHRAPSDPRTPRKLSERDVDALTFIGEAGELAQGQLHIACFRDRAESIVSRWVRRMAQRGRVAIERWNATGINRIRLTRVGRDDLVEHGVDGARLFTPRAALAPGIVAHSLTIVDVSIALRHTANPPAILLTAWAIQRCYRDLFAAAIPDLLAIYQRPDGTPKLALAIEVDLGTEALTRTFLPKLETLRGTLASFAGSSPSAILVLTRGQQRIDTIRRAFADVTSSPVLVESLPHECGRPRIEALQALLSLRS